jgi:hypothetical protein
VSTHIIIDGYNLIRQSRDLASRESLSLELGRSALLEQLYKYKKTRKHPITVVFDGGEQLGHPEQTATIRGVRVIYSRSGQTADVVIQRLVRSERERAIVVTADRDLASATQDLGAAVISSSDFERKMALASEEQTFFTADREENISIRKSTRGKGPSHRPPRAERKARQKIDRL